MSRPVPITPDYELLEQIGSGAYGEVWRARSTATGAMRAIKIVHRSTFADVRPFEREFEGIKKFEEISRSHPSQLAIFHVGRNDAAKCFYYVMELADAAPGVEVQSPRFKVQGIPETEQSAEAEVSSALNLKPETLNSFAPRTLRSDLRTHGRLPAARVLELGLALTEALAHLHQHGLVHRDVKPSNIIFVSGRPKLADIGLVTDVATGDDSRSIVGTEGYLAPEGPGTPQADLFALGKVLYEAVTGLDRRQFPQLPPDLLAWPDAALVFELNEIILKACAGSGRDRYWSTDAMHADLERLRSGKSVRQRHTWQRCVRLGGKLALVAAFISLLAAGLKLVRNRPTPPTANYSGAVEKFETSGTTNREAFNFYLLGRKCSENANPSGYLCGIAHFEKAVALDPKFARAFAEMARAWSRLDAHEHIAPKICQPKAHEAALKALALDDTLVEARVTLASHLATFKWDWDGAERELRHAARLAPENPSPRASLARLLSITGRHEEAIAILRELQRRHPDVMWINNTLGECLSLAGRHAEGEREVRKTLAITPNDQLAHFRLAEILWVMGGHDESLSEWERWSVLRSGSAGGFGEAHKTFRESGMAGFWQFFDKQHQAQLSALKPGDWFPPMNCVWAYAGMGDLDKAFEWLDRACEDKQPLLADVAVHPHYAALWPDPRFRTVLKRMGLDRYFPKSMGTASGAAEAP